MAPPWVPYAERVNEEERERHKAVAEGRVPGAPAPEAAPDDAAQTAPEPAAADRG